MTLREALAGLGAADAPHAVDFDHFPAPAYVIDRAGIVRWINPAGRRLLGDIVDRPVLALIEPRYRAEARRRQMRMLLGTARSNEIELVIHAARGARLRIRASAAPVAGRGGRVVGTFGVVHVLERLDGRRPAGPPLTARQDAVLHLLAAGRSTDEMAAELGLTRTTVRNHVQALLRRLRVHSRVEAVAVARRRGLVEN
jgi:PAS domain S-box-containing protein